MPETLELLKRRRELKKDAITTHMRDWITSNGFDDRDRSIGWALNRLAKEGYLEHRPAGIWRITEKGMTFTLTAHEAREIVERWTERERAARKSQRRRKTTVG